MLVKVATALFHRFDDIMYVTIETVVCHFHLQVLGQTRQGIIFVMWMLPLYPTDKCQKFMMYICCMYDDYHSTVHVTVQLRICKNVTPVSFLPIVGRIVFIASYTSPNDLTSYARYPVTCTSCCRTPGTPFGACHIPHLISVACVMCRKYISVAFLRCCVFCGWTMGSCGCTILYCRHH